MKQFLVVALAAGAVLAAPAFGDSSGPIAGYDGFGSFDDVKGPPLQESDWASTTWGMHVTFAFTNYAGFLFDLQYDTHELTGLTLTPAGPHLGGIEIPHTMGLYPSVDLPGSSSIWANVFPLAAWVDPGVAQQSGITVNSSSLVPLFNVDYQVKATTPANNSDIDITVSAWQILHIVNSGTYNISASQYLYLTPAGNAFAPSPGAGRWFHATTSYTTFIAASAFVATNNFISNVAGYGIEHVPEPAAAAMVLVGASALVLARRRAA